MVHNDTIYILQVSEEYAVLGLPSLDENPAYSGHFANDGAKPPQSESQISTYVLESNDLANAMHIPFEECQMITVATRNIQQGEEILVTYGPEYWVKHATEWRDDVKNLPDKLSGSKGFG